MFAVVLASALTVAPAPVQCPPMPTAPAEPSLPTPIGSIRPDDSGLVLYFGSEPGLGWQFANGKAISARMGRWPLLSCWSSFFETEDVRWSWRVGTALACSYERYLGHGVAVEAEVGLPTQFRLWWYPTESVTLMLGCDPFGRLSFNVELRL